MTGTYDLSDRWRIAIAVGYVILHYWDLMWKELE
tara:strand:- start:2065 stop:2166 length:102 start_codon:yes stop_codon:yes gene_type:complete